MIKDAQELSKIQNIVNQMIANNESPDYIDNFLQMQGETPEGIRALNEIGPERLAEIRANAEKPVELSGEDKARILGQGLASGQRLESSMAQEFLKDMSGGIYGNLIDSELYNNLKQKVKDEAKEGGYSWLESGTRGLAGFAGTMASPLFRIAKFIPGVRNSIIASAGLGNALYSGTQSATRGDNAKDIAINALGSGAVGAGAAGTMLLGEKLLRDITGAATGLGASTVAEAKEAGKRKSTAFKTGRYMTDNEVIEKINNKVSSIKKESIDNLTKGKSKLANTPVDKDTLYSNYKDYYATKPTINNGKTWLGSDQEKAVFDKAQQYINKFDKIKNPTVGDIDRLRRNINAIDAPTGEALAARSELYNITKGAADTATNGAYSQVLKPYEGVANTLEGFSKLNRGTPNASRQMSTLLRNMKTDYGSDTIKRVLGQETYDILLGKATSPWFGRKSGPLAVLSAIGGALSGSPLSLGPMAAIAAGSSPRVVGRVAYGMGAQPATIEELVRPLSLIKFKKSSE